MLSNLVCSNTVISSLNDSSQWVKAVLLMRLDRNGPGAVEHFGLHGVDMVTMCQTYDLPLREEVEYDTTTFNAIISSCGRVLG